MSGILCVFSCNEDKQAKPRTPDCEVVSEYTSVDIQTAREAFNDDLLGPDKNIYEASTAYTAATDYSNGTATIWCQPIHWGMTMNTYKRAKAEGDTGREDKHKQLHDGLFTGNKIHYVNLDFDDDDESTGQFIYDDTQWWIITLARAYELFKVEGYHSLAEANSTHVWYGSPHVGDVGSYTDPEKNLGGDMFWQWRPIGNPNENATGDGRMACINFPTVVAALTLYNNVPADRVVDPNLKSWGNKYGGFTHPHYKTKEAYLARGKEIYEWAVESLVSSNTGEVVDSKHSEDNPAWSDHVYNQATLIGASLSLYKAIGEETCLDSAILGADYTMSVMSGTYDSPPFESSVEQGICTAISVECMVMLVNDCGQTQYVPFLRHNVNYGQVSRDWIRNLCDGEYHETRIRGATIGSYSASGIPALMLLFPADK